MARMRRRFADRSEAAIANADRFGRERIGFTGDASQMGRDLTSGIMNPNLRRADIGPVGRSPLTRNEIAENRWNAIPAGVYDMSGNAKTWFPQIDEEVRGFAYDSGLTPAGGPILTQDEIAENRWNAIPEGNIYDMSPGQDYFGPRNEEYEDFPPWWNTPAKGAVDVMGRVDENALRRKQRMDSINRILQQIKAQPGLNRGGIASLPYAR